MGSALEADVAMLDVLRPGYRLDGPEVLAARAANWYARTPFGVAVLRHDKISQLLTDRRLVKGTHRFLAAQGVLDGPAVDFMNEVILSVEGDDHTRLRTLVSRAFTPRSVAALRPRIVEVANEMVERIAGAGRCEFMAEFADPFPARIICEMLGVPEDLHDTFRGWADDIGLIFSSEVAANLPRIESALERLYAAVDALLEVRRDDPQPDLLTALIDAEADGDRLTPRELRVMVATLFFGGQDTTRNQLGLALARFAAHPDQWALLAERPELADRAVAEVLRLAPTSTGTDRETTVDVELDGVLIPAGTSVMMLSYAGNTDPAVFGPDAEVFDITVARPAAPLTFGGGVHYCLGANLARAELGVALPVLASRLGPVQIDSEPTWRPAMGLTGPITLPIRFGTGI